MSRYDRFRPTSLNDVKERKAEVAEITNQYDNDDNPNRIKRKNIKGEGTFIVRFYPAHPVEGANSIEPKVVYFVPAYVNKKDSDGKWILKPGSTTEYLQELKVRTVFDSRVHGKAEHDLADTYINLVKKKADQLFPDSVDGKKSYLAPIIGNKFQGGTFMGLQPLRSFLAYGELLEGDKSEFYEFEFGRAVEKGIYKTAAIEADGEALGTDGCFTDPLDGRPARIKVDPVAGKNDPSNYYTVSLVTETEKVNVGGRMVSTIKEYPISEEKLDWYEKHAEPLVKYRTAFTSRDLNTQLEGLKLFEAEHQFGVMEMDEFKEVYKYLDAKFPYIPEDEQSNSNDNQGVKTKGGSEDEFDLMDLAELKQFVKSEKLGFIVLPSMSESDVREMIRVVLADEDEEEKEVETETEEENSPSDQVASDEGWRERLDKLKNKTA